MPRTFPVDVEPVLTVEQIEALGRFFTDKGADPKNARRAIHFIDRGMKLYKTIKDNPLKHIEASAQIGDLGERLGAVIRSIQTLSPSARHFLQEATDGSREFVINHVAPAIKIDGRDLRLDLLSLTRLCNLAKDKLPETKAAKKAGKGRVKGQDKVPETKAAKKAGKGRVKGQDKEHDLALAEAICEAYAVAFDAPPDRDGKKVRGIYDALGVAFCPGQVRKIIEILWLQNSP